MASASLYILYAGITQTFNTILWASIALLIFESAVLIANRWTCPLTPLAMKYTPDRSDNFDIYLPPLVAKHNKTIFGAIFITGLLLVLRNVIF